MLQSLLTLQHERPGGQPEPQAQLPSFLRPFPCPLCPCHRCLTFLSLYLYPWQPGSVLLQALLLLPHHCPTQDPVCQTSLDRSCVPRARTLHKYVNHFGEVDGVDVLLSLL